MQHAVNALNIALYKQFIVASIGVLSVAFVSQAGVTMLGQLGQNTSLVSASVGINNLVVEFTGTSRDCYNVMLNDEIISNSIVCGTQASVKQVQSVVIDSLKDQPVQGDTIALCNDANCTNSVVVTLHYKTIRECYALAYHEFYMEAANMYEDYYDHVVQLRKDPYAKEKKKMVMITDSAERTALAQRMQSAFTDGIKTYRSNKLTPKLSNIKSTYAQRKVDCKANPSRSAAGSTENPGNPTNATNPTKTTNPTSGGNQASPTGPNYPSGGNTDSPTNPDG